MSPPVPPPATTRPEVAAPARPRLGDHVVARRYFGGDEPLVVLHDTRSDTQAVIGPREWDILRCADGSRDLEGVRLAARLRGRRLRADQLATFFSDLARIGMLADGLEEPAEGGGTAPAHVDDDFDDARARPDARLEPLAGYRLRCDGRGTCCRVYGTILFDPDEASCASALCPAAGDGAGRELQRFTPARGASFEVPGGGELARAVALVEGRCSYLAPDGGCELHRLGGEGAKPAGCRRYPASFIDDGRAIRVSVRPECGCVLRSAGQTEGEALVPANATRGSELPPGWLVDVLPSRIRLAARETVSRDRYLQWADRALAFWTAHWERLARPNATPEEIGDAPRLLWAMAERLARPGRPEDEELPAFLETPELDGSPDELEPWIASLNDTVGETLARWRTWRSRRDPALRIAEAVRATTEALLRDGAPRPARAETLLQASREAFAVRALVHGHLLVEQQPLSEALRDQSVRLVVARRLALEAPRGDPDWAGEPWAGEPLALVQALVRGHGLWTYVARAARAERLG